MIDQILEKMRRYVSKRSTLTPITYTYVYCDNRICETYIRL